LAAIVASVAVRPSARLTKSPPARSGEQAAQGGELGLPRLGLLPKQLEPVLHDRAQGWRSGLRRRARAKASCCSEIEAEALMDTKGKTLLTGICYQAA
jgi:hypothetical protein